LDEIEEPHRALWMPPSQQDHEAKIAPHHLVPVAAKIRKVSPHLREPVSRGGYGRAELRDLRQVHAQLEKMQQVHDI